MTEYRKVLLGKHGLGFPNITPEFLASHANNSLEETITAAFAENYMLNLSVKIEDFIMGFQFEGFTKDNVKAFKKCIMDYLLVGKPTTQLKGARLKKFLRSKEQIENARTVLSMFVDFSKCDNNQLFLCFK